MALRSQLDQDIIRAMKAHDSERVSALRMLKSAITNESIQHSRRELSEEDVLSVIKREVKKRREAAITYRTAKRLDLSEKEEREIKIFQSYLPEQMPEAEIRGIIEEVIRSNKAVGPQQMGQVMKDVMARAHGRADGSVVSNLVRTYLRSS